MLPGVITLELVSDAALALSEAPAWRELRVDKARFRRPIVPEDTVRIAIAEADGLAWLAREGVPETELGKWVAYAATVSVMPGGDEAASATFAVLPATEADEAPE